MGKPAAVVTAVAAAPAPVRLTLRTPYKAVWGARLNLWLPLHESSSQAVVLALARHGWLMRGVKTITTAAPG